MGQILDFVMEQWYYLLLSAGIVAVLQYMVWQVVKPVQPTRHKSSGRKGKRAGRDREDEQGEGSGAAREDGIGLGAAQDMGDREQQEDAWGFAAEEGRADEKGVLAVLADGMGGLADGDCISRFAVTEAQAVYEGLMDGEEVSEGLSDILSEINRQAALAFNKGKGRAKAGTTLILAHVYRGRLYWAAAGDSRLYVLRDGYLCRMTEDHIYLNERYLRCLKEGSPKETAEADSRAGLLVSYIGQSPLKKTDVSRRGFPLAEGDRILLCSDGVYRSLEEEELAVLASRGTADSACRRIVREVKNKKFKGQDNMTVLMITYEGETV